MSRSAYFPASYALEIIDGTYWARVVGAGHLRDLILHNTRLTNTTRCSKQPRKDTHTCLQGQVYMRTEMDEAHSWLAFVEGKTGDAFGLLQSARSWPMNGEKQLPTTSSC